MTPGFRPGPPTPPRHRPPSGNACHQRSPTAVDKIKRTHSGTLPGLSTRAPPAPPYQANQRYGSSEGNHGETSRTDQTPVTPSRSRFHVGRKVPHGSNWDRTGTAASLHDMRQNSRHVRFPTGWVTSTLTVPHKQGCEHSPGWAAELPSQPTGLPIPTPATHHLNQRRHRHTAGMPGLPLPGQPANPPLRR